MTAPFWRRAPKPGIALLPPEQGWAPEVHIRPKAVLRGDAVPTVGLAEHRDTAAKTTAVTTSARGDIAPKHRAHTVPYRLATPGARRTRSRREESRICR